MSDEAERSVLVKLKTECGYQFTSKLESMFTDIKTSRDTMQEYKARRQASANGEDDVELAVQVPAPALSSPHTVSVHNSQALAYLMQNTDVPSGLSSGSCRVKLPVDGCFTHTQPSSDSCLASCLRTEKEIALSHE